MENPLFSSEGKFIEEEEYVQYSKYRKTGAEVVNVGSFRFRIWRLNSSKGWGWQVLRNGQSWHNWYKGDYDDKGEMMFKSNPAKSKQEALKKCIKGALRCSKEDLQKLNWVLKGLK
jgi:hypothetical protein